MSSTTSEAEQVKAPTQGGGGETLSPISDHSDDEDYIVPVVVNDSDGLTFVNNHFGENAEVHSLDTPQTIGKGIYTMYREGEVINPTHSEINAVLSTLDIVSKELNTIAHDLDTVGHEDEELKVKTDLLDMNFKSIIQHRDKNTSRLEQLQKEVEEKTKIVVNEKSATLFQELMVSQQEIETLLQQQEEIEKSIVDLTFKRSELEEMRKGIDLKMSKLIALKSDTEVKIHDAEIALHNAFQKSETDSKVEEIASNVVTFATHTAMSETLKQSSAGSVSRRVKPMGIPDEDDHAKYAEHITSTVCRVMDSHKYYIERTTQQLKSTQEKRIECGRQYRELETLESNLKINLEDRESCFKDYNIECKSQMINDERYSKMRTLLAEMAILSGVIYFGTKSKDIWSLTAMNPRFCVDDLQGTVHFFTKDWTYTKSLTLSDENTKVPMNKRDTCISETKDFNYNLTQMKHAIILVNDIMIIPVIHYWK